MLARTLQDVSAINSTQMCMGFRCTQIGISAAVKEGDSPSTILLETVTVPEHLR